MKKLMCISCPETKSYIGRDGNPLECDKGRVHDDIKGPTKYCLFTKDKIEEKWQFPFIAKCTGQPETYCSEYFPDFTICNQDSGVCENEIGEDM